MAEMEAKRPHVVEPAGALWSEAALIGAGAAIGAGGLFLLPTVQGHWPAWYAPCAGLALAPLAIRRKMPPWAPVAGALAFAAPALIREWPWYMPGLAGTLAGTVAFCGAAFLTTLHHRGLLQRALDLLELATRADLNRDGKIAGRPASLPPAPIRLVYSNLSAPTVEDARYEAEGPDPAEDLDYYDRLDFGYFVAKLWPAEGQGLPMGTAGRAWEPHVMPSGVKLGRPRWREYCERLVRAGLARRANEASNAPYVLRATRRQALEALQEAIVIPQAEGEAQAEGAGDEQ